MLVLTSAARRSVAAAISKKAGAVSVASSSKPRFMSAITAVKGREIIDSRGNPVCVAFGCRSQRSLRLQAVTVLGELP